MQTHGQKLTFPMAGRSRRRGVQETGSHPEMHFRLIQEGFGSPGWSRTNNLTVNSRLLYR